MIVHCLVIVCLALAHGGFLLRLAARLRLRQMPSTREFVIASFFLYYDSGLLAESLGMKYRNTYFLSIFSAPDGSLAVSLLIIIVSPWIIDFASAIYPRNSLPSPVSQSELKSSRRPAFYLFTGGLAVACVVLAARLAQNSIYIWTMRERVAKSFGPFILILYFPLFALAFYVRQKDSHSRWGRAFIVLLVLCSVLATIPIGERSLILLPFVIVLLFWKGISFRVLAIGTLLAIIGAALLLPIFKWQSAEDNSVLDLVSATFDSDFIRAPILADVVIRTDALGSQIFDYPGEGYVYSAFFFVPRRLVPFKGRSTAIAYTAHVDNTAADDLTWGLGISAIDELLLNFGFIILPIGLAAYGLAIGLADRLSDLIPGLLVPTRFSAVFLLGYNLPALLQVYGAMAITGCILHGLFVKDAKQQLHSLS